MCEICYTSKAKKVETLVSKSILHTFALKNENCSLTKLANYMKRCLKKYIHHQLKPKRSVTIVIPDFERPEGLF
jgi:hypothetical protein